MATKQDLLNDLEIILHQLSTKYDKDALCILLDSTNENEPRVETLYLTTPHPHALMQAAGMAMKRLSAENPVGFLNVMSSLAKDAASIMEDQALQDSIDRFKNGDFEQEEV